MGLLSLLGIGQYVFRRESIVSDYAMRRGCVFGGTVAIVAPGMRLCNVIIFHHIFQISEEVVGAQRHRAN